MDINELIAPKPINYNRTGRPSKRPDAVELLTKYRDNTADELSKLYRVAPSTVRRWIHDAREQLKEAQHGQDTEQQTIHD